jgi:hypothetical protein
MTPFTPSASPIPMPSVRPPVPTRRWGIRLDGCGAPLEDLIRQHVHGCPPERAYTLLEVGSAGCVSLRSFRDIVAEACGPNRWSVIGTDLPPGRAWSLDMVEVQRSIGDVPHMILRLDQQPVAPDLDWADKITLCLHDDPRAWLHQHLLDGHVDFVFIDGSHGRSCGLDFLAIEAKVAPGGVVVFHDYGEAEQGTDWQAYDREFISVRNYVHRLGLAQPSNAIRKGWRFVGEIPGSRRFGGDGNSCAVVQRTTEALESQPELSLD